MNNQVTKHTERFKIRASEVDVSGKTTLPAICSLFQEIAGNHALSLNFDISQLHEQDLTWVLQRMNIKMARYPDWREAITIETWPAAGDSLRAYRDYIIFDSQGVQIGCCLSYWMIINLNTRRPVRMPQGVQEMRFADIEHTMPVKTERLKPFNKTDFEKSFTVRKSDMDMNKHVNNARFVEWMTETLPPSHPQINEIDIAFLRESHYEDKIISQAQIVDNTTSAHQLTNQKNEVIALGEFITI